MQTQKGRRSSLKIEEEDLARITGMSRLRWQNISITIKWIIMISGLMTVSQISQGISSHYVAVSAQEGEIESTREVLAKVFADNNLIHFTQPGGREILQLSLNKLMSSEDVRKQIIGVVAINSKLEVLASNEGKSEIMLHGLEIEKIKIPTSIKTREDIVRVIAPAIYDNKTDGYVIFDFSQEYIQEARMNIFYQTVKSVFAWLIASMLLAFAFVRQTTKPIVTLTEHINEMKKGNLDVRIQKPRGNDEIAKLTQAMIDDQNRRKKGKIYTHPLTWEVIEDKFSEEAIMRNLFIIFCDVVGYTQLSDKQYYTPAEMKKALTDAFNITRHVTESAELLIFNFMGDGVHIVGGADKEEVVPEDGKRAMRGLCSLQTLLYLNAFKNGQFLGKYPLIFRSGVGFGPVLIGPSGADEQKMFTTNGPTVNVTSRLEGAGKKGQVASGHKAQEMVGRPVTEEEAAELVKQGKTVLKNRFSNKLVESFCSIRESETVTAKNVSHNIAVHHIDGLAWSEDDRAVRQFCWDYFNSERGQKIYRKNISEEQYSELVVEARRVLGIDENGELTDQRLVIPDPKKEWFPDSVKLEGKVPIEEFLFEPPA